MNTKQEMKSRSIYMPSALWNYVDKAAEENDLSANQVIRRLVSEWFLDFDKEEKARPALTKISAPSRKKRSAAERITLW